MLSSSFQMLYKYMKTCDDVQKRIAIKRRKVENIEKVENDWNSVR